MKAQMKAVMASAVVIVLALAAVSGVTYSWWSDSNNSDITIETGHFSVDTSVDGWKITKTMVGQTTPVTIKEGSNEIIPKTIGINDFKTANTSNLLGFEYLQYGDVISYEYSVKFTSNIAAKHAIFVTTNPESIMDIDYSITTNGMDVDVSPWTDVPEATNGISSVSYKVNITMKCVADSDKMGEEFVITLHNEIMQSAAPEPSFGDSGIKN
ncbi:MAG: SipW-dependent-type signal peptide-containing protein, partial [Candidatus Methanomethylophilaceae archaeon]|nr:SipW-dependent-type signal peptide-containing protein [Candidatus Methanomethylophilaceae archaeon]